MGGDTLNQDDRREGLILPPEGNSRIELVVNQQYDDEGDLDLGRMFHKMKRRLRVYAWVMLFFFALGLCLPLLLYQLGKAPLTAASVVTLRYDVVTRDPEGKLLSSAPVEGLTAPDGGELDLNQLTSSYVLQSALEGLELSAPVSLENLRANLRIDRILTEESRRRQELASQMVTDKNAGAYEEIQNIELLYDSRFVVYLTNGFGDEDSKRKQYLTDGELRTVLDRILTAYNDYLALTYADVKLPDDEFAAVDTEKQDILESLDLIRTAVQDLYDFCAEQPESILRYRSWRTGFSLEDLMGELETLRSVNVNYLYSYVTTNSIARDREAMITSYRYQLRNAQTKLDALNMNIATNRDILDNYKNDEIFVSMQESDTSRSTRTTTDYYNRLILEQADNYDKVAKLEETIADLEYKLESLTAAEDRTSGISGQEITDSLASTLEICRNAYARIREQLSEIHDSAFFTDYAEHSVPQGKTPSFLAAAWKKAVIGGAAGLVLACGLWLLDGVAQELRAGRRERFPGEEGTEA